MATKKSMQEISVILNAKDKTIRPTGQAAKLERMEAGKEQSGVIKHFTYPDNFESIDGEINIFAVLNDGLRVRVDSLDLKEGQTIKFHMRQFDDPKSTEAKPLPKIKFLEFLGVVGVETYVPNYTTAEAEA